MVGGTTGVLDAIQNEDAGMMAWLNRTRFPVVSMYMRLAYIHNDIHFEQAKIHSGSEVDRVLMLRCQSQVAAMPQPSRYAKRTYIPTGTYVPKSFHGHQRTFL